MAVAVEATAAAGAAVDVATAAVANGAGDKPARSHARFLLGRRRWLIRRYSRAYSSLCSIVIGGVLYSGL
jgi:hypothetical protein